MSLITTYIGERSRSLGQHIPVSSARVVWAHNSGTEDRNTSKFAGNVFQALTTN